MRPSIRTNSWLDDRLKLIWSAYYSDARVGLPIDIRFGKPAQYRFGSIRQKADRCQIYINPLFALPEVPEYVIDATMVHELAHYVHGYGSGLTKLHAHPHRGGVIDKELENRGCAHLEEMAAKWRKQNWAAHYQTHQAVSVNRRAERTNDLKERWQTYLAQPGMRSMTDIQRLASRLAPRFGISSITFALEWLYPSARKTGLSYWYRAEDVVRIHPLLADPSVPEHVVQYELMYWLAAHKIGSNWVRIQREIAAAGLSETAQKGINWRHRTWRRKMRVFR